IRQRGLQGEVLAMTDRSFFAGCFRGCVYSLTFVMFTLEEQRRLVGFALYRQAVEVDNIAARARKILEDGSLRRGAWRALVEAVLSQLGGEADLEQLYAAIEPRRPTANAWWKEKVRQVLLHFEPVARGRWRLSPVHVAAAVC